MDIDENNGVRLIFSSRDGGVILSEFKRAVRDTPDEIVGINNFNIALINSIEIIENNASFVEERCIFNSRNIGDQFLNAMQRFHTKAVNERSDALQDIFTMAYRFLRELEFSIPNEPDGILRSIINFVENSISQFDGKHQSQLIYASAIMPVNLMKATIHHPNISLATNLDSKLSSLEKLKGDWDEDMKKRQEKLDALKDSIKDLTAQYNFVGLVDGFRSMEKKKERERRFSLNWLVVLSFLMIALPIIQVSYIFANIENFDKKKDLLIYIAPAILAMEIILLYFFRVLLGHFRSIKAQMLQLDLRISLCQFIQSYVEYAKDGRAKATSSLDKFESIIFSGIASDEAKIPSTFDGVEQMAGLIKSLRG
ncbi:hypothetical protein [Delftia acidovorans]